MAVAVTPAGDDESLPAFLGDDPANVVVGRAPGQVAVVVPLVGTHLLHKQNSQSTRKMMYLKILLIILCLSVV